MYSFKTTLIFIIICSIFVSLGFISVSTSLYAQEKYPAREIELIIPWAPGGTSDILGRIFASELAKIIKAPITSVNKAGASGTIGAAYVHKSKKDGYTIMISSLGWLIGSILLDDVPYDPLKDFIPIARISTTPRVIFVKSDSPFKTIEDLIGSAKKNPNFISCGTGGTASDSNFNLQIFQKAAGVEFNIIPFKGGGEVTPAVLGGHVDVGISVMSVVLPFTKAGNIKILLISGMSRTKEFPDVPTFKEKGFTQSFLENWNALSVPAGVPKYVIDTLTLASDKAIKSKELAIILEKTGNILEYMRSAEQQRMVENERKIIETIAGDMGLKRRK